MAYTLSNIRKLYTGASAGKDAVQQNVDVTVDKGRITEVKPASGRKGADVIDCSSYYVAPGIIDSHSHITVEGLTDKDLADFNGPVGMLYVERVLYRTLVDAGVTSMRDMGGATDMMRRLVDRGVVLGPRLNLSICMLSTTGGHADRQSCDRCHGEVSKLFPPMAGRPSSVVDDPWNARLRVREVVACGADFIKICAGRGLTGAGGNIDNLPVDFTTEELIALCEEAASRGREVAAHAHGSKGIEAAIKAGVKHLQHVSYISERGIQLAIDHKCTITPTVWALKTVCTLEPFRSLMINPDQVIADHARNVKAAVAAGVTVLVGSDPVFAGMHGQNYKEMACLREYGLSALQVWYGATGAGAKAMGRSDIGQIAVGSFADFTIFKKDVIDAPEDITSESFVDVIKEGRGYRGGIRGIEQVDFRSTLQSRL